MSSVEQSIQSANSWNNAMPYVAAGGALISIGSSIYGAYSQNKIAKYQARIAKAQAQIQANNLAAESVSYEQSALRLAQAFGAQDYETRRQQNAHLEDMTLDAAIRGSSNEGTNAYMKQAQAAEFERSNAYAQLSNDRQQANYMSAANDALASAQSALAAGRIEARSIRSSARLNAVTGIVNSIGGSLGSFAQIYGNYQSNKMNIALAADKYGVRNLNNG